VATIYYNRGVDLLGRREFAEAMAANCKAVRLDRSNKTAWGNLLATLNNWAIAEGSSGRFVEAIALLETGLAVEPGFGAFASNYTHVHHRWVEALCGQGRHEEALEHLSRAAAIAPNQPWFRQASQDVLRHWSQTRAAAGRIGASVSPGRQSKDTVEPFLLPVSSY
jgi:tetratricopeptide (TPR) repeat protein